MNEIGYYNVGYLRIDWSGIRISEDI